MNRRSIILGLAAVVFLSAFCYFNDYVIRQGNFISSLMPVAAYGGLVFFLLCVQPLLRRIRGGRAALTGREVAAILALFLLASGIPGLGLVQYLPTAVMMPHHDIRVKPGWAAEDVVSIAPERMLADVQGDENRALDGYVTGLAEGDRHISPFDVPWHAWTRTLGFWIPLLLCATLALLGLAAVFHTQWAHHEQLPYPITRFTKALLPDADGKPGIFSNRLFWIGFSFVFLINMNNYLRKWFPDLLIPVQTAYDFSAFRDTFPVFVRGAGHGLFYPRLWFPIIALAYFLPSDVSFSMTVCPFIYCFIFGTFAKYGVPFRCGRMLGPSIEQSIYAGGYSAIVLMMLYTGRYYYRNVFMQSLGMRSNENIEPHAIWGMRTFMVCTALFIVQLVCIGLDWQLAIVYTAFAFMVHIVISRMIVETGGFIIGTYVYPGVMIWAFCGAAALGPRTMLIMFLVSTVLVSGPGWAAMPFFVQALNLSDVSKVNLKRTAKWGLAVVILSVLIAVPCTIYWQYDRGAPTSGWARATAWYSFENMVETKQKLRGQGVLEQAETVHGWQRLSQISPHWDLLTAYFIAMGIALGFGIARLRFTWWPFHPMAFVFLGGWPGYYHWFSFFLGWLLKTIAAKYGGEAMYQKLKPLMIGLIAGEMLGKFVPMVVGPIWYLATGEQP